MLFQLGLAGRIARVAGRNVCVPQFGHLSIEWPHGAGPRQDVDAALDAYPVIQA